MSLRDRLRRWQILMFNWQHWPWPVVYTPLLLQYFFHILKFPGAGFPTLINRPFMALGGILEESKISTAQKIPKGWVPKTLLIPAFQDVKSLETFLEYHQLRFPLIVKPDRGMRGKGVRLHRNIQSLLSHCQALGTSQPHLVQSYVDLPSEIGIFMILAEDGWHITSLIERQLPAVTGNGRASVEDLIRTDDQLFLHLERWRNNTELDLTYIPEVGEIVVLGQIGNHRLGTKFVDRREWITPRLEMAMKRICDLMKGFEYGRLDIRYRHWESFLELKDFSIIEVNGANSEPGHIYSEGFSLFEAWKVLFRHHSIIYEKARFARNTGYKAPNFWQCLALFRDYLRTMKLS